LISNLKIRTETNEDRIVVERLVENSFKDLEFSDGTEHELVRSLRSSANFIADLSLVAQIEEQIVGYILMTMVKIQFAQGWQPSLALAPMAVDPAFQGKGIGSALVETAHEKARELGYPSAVVIGHKDYYPRFGYKSIQDFGIKIPFDIPVENCFIIHLRPECRLHSDGRVEYGDEFFG